MLVDAGVRAGKCGVATSVMLMLYGCRLGENFCVGLFACWPSEIVTGSALVALGVLISFHGPNFSSVRARTAAASSGSSIFQRLMSTLGMPRVRRAQSQP